MRVGACVGISVRVGLGVGVQRSHDGDWIRL